MKDKIVIKQDIFLDTFRGEIERLDHLGFRMFTNDAILYPLERDIEDRIYAVIWFKYTDKDGMQTGATRNIKFFKGPVSPNQWFTFNNFLEQYINLKKVLLQWSRLKGNEKDKKKIQGLIKKFEKQLSDENRLKLEVSYGDF